MQRNLFAGDERPVGDLRADRANEPLRVRVGSRAAERGLADGDADIGEDGTAALSQRALSAPQIFRHEAQDGRQGSHQSLDSARNKTAIPTILETS
jgi:hypothetical protein